MGLIDPHGRSGIQIEPCNPLRQQQTVAVIVSVDPENRMFSLRFPEHGTNLQSVDQPIGKDCAFMRKNHARTGSRRHGVPQKFHLLRRKKKPGLMTFLPGGFIPVVLQRSILGTVIIGIQRNHADPVPVKPVIAPVAKTVSLQDNGKPVRLFKIMIPDRVVCGNMKRIVSVDDRFCSHDIVTEIAAVHDEIDLFPFRPFQNPFQPFRRRIPVAVPVMQISKHAEFHLLHKLSTPFFCFQ